MASSDFELWDASSTNIASQATYIASTDLADGVANGEVASSLISNKLFRQASAGMAVIGQFILNVLGVNVVDNGSLSTLVTQFTNALTTFVEGLSITPYHITAPVTPSQGTIINEAHGLGTLTAFTADLWLQPFLAAGTQNGYTYPELVKPVGGNQSTPYTISVDSTYVNCAIGNGSSTPLAVAVKSTGEFALITPANWNAFVILTKFH